MATQLPEEGLGGRGRQPDVSGARPERHAVGQRRRPRLRMQESPLARGLGWLSVGLGAAALLAPRRTAQTVGLPDHGVTVALVGTRELLTGVGLLSPTNPTPWLWGRVAGDVMDLALLAVGARAGRPARRRALATIGVVGGVTAVDLYASVRQTRAPLALAGGAADVFVERSIVVNKSPAECNEFWRRLENLGRFMRHLVSVQQTGERRSHWVARGPAGVRVEWDAEIVEERPGELLRWRALEGGDIEHAGSVRFERGPGGRGTLVRVTMHYRPPVGAVGVRVARLLGEEPDEQVADDLRSFKAVLKTRELPTTQGQLHDPLSLLARLTREGRLS